MIRTAFDAGVNFVKTADVYSAGESEEIVGKALMGRRDLAALATKFHSRRLGSGRIDVCQAHRPSPALSAGARRRS